MRVIFFRGSLAQVTAGLKAVQTKRLEAAGTVPPALQTEDVHNGSTTLLLIPVQVCFVFVGNAAAVTNAVACLFVLYRCC